MLSRIYASIALSLLTTTCLFTGCVIRGGEGTLDDDETPTTTTTTTSSSATTGGGGEGGTGGTGAGVGGSGGGGGGSACVGVDGPKGLDVKSCDNMNITPVSEGGSAASICDDMGGSGGTNPPPGYAACQHGFDVFNGGPAEHFQACLAKITVEPANACSFMHVQACVDGMYAATCEVKETTDLCDAIGQACAAANPPQAFDIPGCAAELKPFNQKALTAYSDCFDAQPENVACQAAHDQCFVEQL
jgi:hypothetical protein